MKPEQPKPRTFSAITTDSTVVSGERAPDHGVLYPDALRTGDWVTLVRKTLVNCHTRPSMEASR